MFNPLSIIYHLILHSVFLRINLLLHELDEVSEVIDLVLHGFDSIILEVLCPCRVFLPPRSFVSLSVLSVSVCSFCLNRLVVPVSLLQKLSTVLFRSTKLVEVLYREFRAYVLTNTSLVHALRVVVWLVKRMHFQM